MARFAQVRQGVNPQTAHAVVVEILDDGPGPLAERFHAAFVAALIPEGPGMLLGGTWDGTDFGPVPAPPPPPSADARIDHAGDIFIAFLKAYAEREGLTLAQVRDAIKSKM